MYSTHEERVALFLIVDNHVQMTVSNAKAQHRRTAKKHGNGGDEVVEDKEKVETKIVSVEDWLRQKARRGKGKKGKTALRFLASAASATTKKGTVESFENMPNPMFEAATI